MFLKSVGFAFDEKRVHSVKVTLGKNPATQVVEPQKLELQTDTWHQDVTLPGEIQQCFHGIELLKQVELGD